MIPFLLKKSLILLLSLWVVVTGTFFIMHALPGDPFLGRAGHPPRNLENPLRSLWPRSAGLDPIYQIFEWAAPWRSWDFDDLPWLERRSSDSAVPACFSHARFLCSLPCRPQRDFSWNHSQPSKGTSGKIQPRW